MTLTKVLAGVPLLLVDLFSPLERLRTKSGAGQKEENTEETKACGARPEADVRTSQNDGERFHAGGAASPITDAERASSARAGSTAEGQVTTTTRSSYMLHESLPVAAFLGFALVARGEIGVRLSISPFLSLSLPLPHVLLLLLTLL